MDTKRFFLYAIVIAALALAGCGGNGGGTDTAMPDPMPDPTPTPSCPEGQTGTPPNCMDPTPAQPSAMTLALIDGIVNPTTPGDPSTATPTTAGNRPGNGSNEVFAVTPGGRANTADPTPDVAGEMSVATHKPTTTIGNDTLGKDDPTLNVQFEATNPSGNLGEFAWQTHERQTRPLVTDTVTVFTNIAPASPMLFTAYYAPDGQGANRPGVAAATATTGDVKFHLTLDSDMLGDKMLAAATKFPGAGKDAMFDTEAEKRFAGTFNGVPGTFMCTHTAGACTAATDKDGELTLGGIDASDAALTGDAANVWRFTPDGDLETLKVDGVNYDADYLSFGYWVRERESATSSRFSVGTFYAGSQPYTGFQADVSASVGALMGSATYVGEAAGQYALKGDTTEAGSFTADANLTARFGGGAAVGRYAISGTISNFVNGSNGMVDEGWTLTLDPAGFTSGGGTPTYTATFTGTTTGSGNWQGEFFGNPPADPTTGGQTADATDDYPIGVAGEFTGHFDNGHVIGAFGATR